MTTSVARDKRFILAALIAFALALAFWSGSRYPDLGEKADLGPAAVLQDPLGFEALLYVDPFDPYIKRVTYTTVNWLDTNKKGMTFGVLFAAIFMTLFVFIRRWRSNRLLPNTLLGVAMGTPLGVCVNCAAPIARGMYASGARIETMLAAMISSPSLNIVVLTMMFSLFSLHIALTKLLLTLFFILVCIPVMTRIFFTREELENRAGIPVASAIPDFLTLDDGEDDQFTNWIHAFRWVARSFLKNLWFIVRYTVPLMFLAGFLGAIAVTAVPLESMADYFVSDRLTTILLGLCVLALIGLFLPVPIAFDVVVCASLLASGIPSWYVMVLLVSLGMFSVYSFSIVWQAVSIRVAVIISASLLALSILAGVGMYYYEQWNQPRQREIVISSLQSVELPPRETAEPQKVISDAKLTKFLQGAEISWSPISNLDVPHNITLEASQYQSKSLGDQDRFQKLNGSEFGLTRPDTMPIVYKFVLGTSRPIGAGDVHNDGWDDILLGSADGLYLFANQKGETFLPQKLPTGPFQNRFVSNLAFIDINNDGWLDIFASVYRGGNFVVINQDGRFLESNLKKFPDTGSNLVKAIGFSDLDRDGDLDGVLGNWSLGRGGVMSDPLEKSRNAVLWNNHGQFRTEMMDDIPGETLSVLISDIDLDGYQDVLIGNDFAIPDFFLFRRKRREPDSN